jgi:hypothetical protein
MVPQIKDLLSHRNNPDRGRSAQSKSTQVADGELESEQGCLVYFFEIRISGDPGIEEIVVDAGAGKILSHKHESPKQEAAEQSKDKASSKKP